MQGDERTYSSVRVLFIQLSVGLLDCMLWECVCRFYTCSANGAFVLCLLSECVVGNLSFLTLLS